MIQIPMMTVTLRKIRKPILNQFEKMALPLNSMDHLEIEYSGVINFSGVLMALYQFAGNSPVKLKISMDKVEDHV